MLEDEVIRCLLSRPKALLMPQPTGLLQTTYLEFLLVLLDTFEHLLGEPGGEFVLRYILFNLWHHFGEGINEVIELGLCMIAL